MGPKKKGRANKLARMTEEEKLRYLQHKAAMEEEAQRRKQELVVTFLKTKMVHEEAFTRLNSAKINQQWRKILRQIKCKELKEDMETMKQRFEVGLECKNNVIDNLLKDFKDAEFQYSLQYQTQMEIILKLLDLHKSRFSNLQNWYNSQVKEMLEDDTAEKKKLKEEFQRQKNKLQEMYDDYKQKSGERTEELISKFNTNKNELQTKLLYVMVKMEEKYSDEIRKLKNQCNEVLKQHSQNTDTKKAHFNILSNKDDADTAKITDNFEEIDKFEREIQDAKNKYQNLIQKNENEINALKIEKENIRKEHRKFREKNEKILAKDDEQLTILTDISNRTIKKLKTTFKKGVALLQVVDVGHKFQNNPSNDEIPKISFKVEQTEENLLSECISYKKFNLFWREFAEMKLRSDDLKKKKLELIAENKKLKKSLQMYMTSARRSSSVPRKCGF